MTKWKGQAASYAPNLAQVAVGILTLSLTAGPASAADRYWDPNGTSANRGGAGSWNLSSPFWSPSGDGVSGPYTPWNNAPFDNAVFGGPAAGTVTLGAGINAHSLSFETDGYVLNGSTLTLGGVAPTITTAVATSTINSILAGTSGLTKAGAGTLVLNGANSFSGAINVTGGGFNVNGDAALGAADNNLTMAAGTSLTSAGALNATRQVTLAGGTVAINGAGVGSARFTGAGGVHVGRDATVDGGITLSNNANDYTGKTAFRGTVNFTSIADLGVASALGAATTTANGTIVLDAETYLASIANYTGGAASSNRNWSMRSTWFSDAQITNSGTGKLTLTGNINTDHSGNNYGGQSVFHAASADLDLLGSISGSTVAGKVGVWFTGGGISRTVTLGGANTYLGSSRINNVTVAAQVLADTGVVSSFGTGTAADASMIINNGRLSYVGAGNGSNRNWTLENSAAIANDGSGALNLSGTATVATVNDTLVLGGTYTGASNTFSGVVSGKGHVVSAGAGTWLLSGTNTYAGTTTVQSGTLKAGNSQVFGAVGTAIVNGGTLDLNGFATTLRSLSGTGGSVTLTNADLTLHSASNTSYAGSMTGNGGFIKRGTGTLTLSGASSYTGATTANGGTLALDFSSADAPASNIISSASTLNMLGGTLSATGAAGAASSQTFNGVNITAGSNRISATSSAGGSMTLNLGAINRTDGLVDFVLPASGNITTTNSVLGGWAMVNGTDYAKVVGGNITAFTKADYTSQNNASLWASGQYITDEATAPGHFYNTVNGSVQLGGLRYTRAAASTVAVASGQTLGTDGVIIVASTVGNNDQLITGGSLTAGTGGGVLGIQQNSAGTFTIASTIVDNGGATGFTKAGTGTVLLTHANTYTGATTLSEGMLSVSSIANGGVASAIGASSAASSNLVIENGILNYTGGSATSDRGFTLTSRGPSREIRIDYGLTNLTLGGQVVSDDGSGFVKTGPGKLTLTNGTNNYGGVTTVRDGTLAVSTLANGGQASSIGTSSAAPANLVLDGGVLEYLGATTAIDRGFTLGDGLNGTNSGTVGVTGAATTLTVSGTVVGKGRLIKEGVGTLVLSGANTYTGGTVVNGGTLRAGAAGAFAGNGMTVNAGGRLDLGGFDLLVGSLSGAGVVDLGGKTLTAGDSGGNFSGKITGTGGLTKTGPYTLTLSGCQSDYTGVTLIKGPLLVDCLANGGQTSGIGASSATSSNLVFSSGTLIYSGGNQTTDRGFTLQGWGKIDVRNAATTLAFEGQVVGGGDFSKAGSGTLVLAGNNTYTGSTTVSAGILRAGSTTAFGKGSVSLADTAGTTLDLNGYNISTTYLQGGGAAGGTVQLNGANLTITNGNVRTDDYFGGKIIGAGNLIKNGADIQRLTGCASDYTGSTAINRGAIEVACLRDGGQASSIGSSSAASSNLVINGGTLRYIGTGDSSNRQFTLGASGGNALDASGTGAINLTSTAPVSFTALNTAQTLTLTGTSAAANRLSGLLSNNGSGVTSLTKTGAGTWILSNPASTYTGITTISGGVLGVDKLADGGQASSIGASSFAAFNLVIGNNSTLRYTGTGDTTNRLFTLAAGTTFIESSGTGAVVFTDTRPVTLAGSNQNRTIALGGTNAGNNTLAGSIGDAGTGKTILAKNDAGTWVLTGNNTFTGDAVVNAGRLVLGNGGTTGSIKSDAILAGGNLAFNRSDAYTYGGKLSDAGGIEQIGTGTTILTGANSYTGTTNVTAGTLLVNGNQSAATGLTMVGAAGALGGTGTIGGSVNVAGGILTPGSNGTGTLTINGSLSLDGASKLAMQFGQAGAAGGALNDLIAVNGNVTLDGTINVTQTAGGTYGPGVYRVISYSGSLTDNGLNIGTLPSGSGLVQTSVTGQVNLVSGGTDFSFWDGNAGPKNNNAVNGGNGTWQSKGTLNNWTEANGAINAAYKDGTFAIFQGAAGIVTVDNGLGQVSASGMQFATDGYTITGSPIALVGPQSTIRVGDGSVAGADMTATLAAQLNGNTQLVKTDAGTLMLGNNNGYTGGTAINGGTLRVASDANLGSAAGGLSFNGGTLNSAASFSSARAVALAGAGTFNTDANTTLMQSGSIIGSGALTKAGAGTLTLTGDAAHTGGTTIAAGTLQIGNGGTTGSIIGNIVNNGALIFNRSDNLAYAGAVSGAGSLSKIGAGTVTMTGTSTYTGKTTVNGGKLVLQSGGQIIGTSAVESNSSQASEIIVDGVGSCLVAGPGLSAIAGSASSGGSNNASGSLTVRNGGTASFNALNLVDTIGGSGNMTITGAGSSVTHSGLFHAGNSSMAQIDILNGGRLSGLDVNLGGLATSSGVTLAISGAGSQWDVINSLLARQANIMVSDGGVAKAGTAVIGYHAGGSIVQAPDGSLMVTGAGSRFETTGGLSVANLANDNAKGVVTIADGGVVKVGSGKLAMGPGDAVLNVGGAEGQAAAHAGMLDAASVVMAATNNRINFNHDTAGYTFNAAISGTGAVNHDGSGETVLTGNNSYTGATTVNAGGLYIDGDQSAATGLTTVKAGTMLGGKGVIGGDVTVADGAALNPGSIGSAPGTLGIKGALNLGANSILNYNFGQANTVGGALNDLVNVSGNLVLDGTLNVQTSGGGSFDPGLYRVINYGGTLTNNGLVIGTIPSPDFYVQTSVPGQVNLINTAGMTLRFWDGSTIGSRNNAVVEGGDGTWQNYTGNDNWTQDNGAINAPFTDNAFAVFMGAAGNVAVDGSKGAINASGMQFLTDGYVVGGDAINLTGGASSTIRVGDGTAGGSTVVATINSVLSGNTQLVKTDAGTLVLTAANTYAGGTAIDGGTLRIASDANLGSAAGGLSLNGGALNTTSDMVMTRDVTLKGAGGLITDANTTLTVEKSIVGAGSLTKDGNGSLVLQGNSVYGGGTTIKQGRLQLGDGGTSGGITGDIINDGLLAANRSDTLKLDGKISGSGAFAQDGTGITYLNRNNSYAGATDVNAGMLLVNGDQSSAKGLTTVRTGAALGGAGIIGGDVSIADGAALQPGNIVGAASTLTINGSLSLSGGSALHMQFGEANVAGGAFNDLVEVKGDLMLDGTLNVSASSGGTFGAGIYRVINYDGSLTNNGLNLGAMPNNDRVFLQTSVDHQVNLINTTGLTLNYWDGDAGPKFDRKIAGGNGAWQNSNGNYNWTDAAGDINAPYADSAFAIFTGAAGTVVIDNGLGQVRAQGMQFATDGYRVEGGELELTGQSASIRVGDGTQAGADMIATIGSVLRGPAQLVKSDAGTLILTGANTYTGGTMLQGGVLQVAADTALGDKAGGLTFSGGTLHTTDSITSDRMVNFTGGGKIVTDTDKTLTLNGALSGAGSFDKSGNGTVVLTADSSGFTGQTGIDAGTLVANGVLAGGLGVNQNGRLEGIGTVGTTTNSGVVVPGTDGGMGTLTVNGDYIGNDGRLEIATVLGNDASQTSRLVVNGSTSGNTLVNVTNRNGLGAQTIEGIKIIDVGGVSNGAFTLGGDYMFEGQQAVVGGAYAYRLYKGGVSSPTDGDWYLRSELIDKKPLLQVGVPLYESYAGSLQAFNKLGTLQQRVGNRSWGESASTKASAKADRVTQANGVWARIEAAHTKFDPAISTSGTNYNANVWKLQTGIDGLLLDNNAGTLVGGLSVQFGSVSSGVSSIYGHGSAETTGYGVGATLTWYGANGFYADGQAQVTGYNTDLNSSEARKTVADGNNAIGYALSLEAGQRIVLTDSWSLMPQAQLAWSSVNFSDFTDSFGADVALQHSRSLLGRLGLAANHDTEWRSDDGRLNRMHLYGIANLYYDFADGSQVDVANVSFSSRNDRLLGGIGVGGSINWVDDKYSLYGDAQLNTSMRNFGDSNAIAGTLGFRMNW